MSVQATTSSDLASLSLEDEQSPINAIISTIKKDVEPQSLYANLKFIQTPLKNYVVGLNIYRNILYVRAEVDSDCLDHGSEPEEIALTLAPRDGLPSDRLHQLIGKQLGGHGNLMNVFPVNSMILAEWRNDEATVYSRVKTGNCTASLFYGIKYDDEENLRRPSDFYYQFQFFKNGKVVGESIERHIKNSC